MHVSDRLLRGCSALALVLVIGALCWLLYSELKTSGNTFTQVPEGGQRLELDELREKLYNTYERQKKLVALNLSGRFTKANAAAEALRASLEGIEGRLGKSLRPDPTEPFQPRALFVDYLPGSARMRFVDWKIKGGSAVYSFLVVYSHHDLPDETCDNVRDKERVGKFRIAQSSSPTRIGASYEEKVRTTPRGVQIKRMVKLPNFRVARLSLEQVAGHSGNFVVETAYSEGDRAKAKRSGYVFEDTLQWDIPLARLEICDAPNSQVRSIILREGSLFEFAGRQYVVSEIHPDHMQVKPVGASGALVKWMRSDASAEATPKPKHLAE